MQALPLEAQIGAVYFVESENKNFRCVTFHVLPELQYIEEGDDTVLLGSDEPPFVQDEDWHATPGATGTISGPSVSAVVNSAATFTVAASAFPVYAVLRKSGADVGSRVAVTEAGTVELTPLTTGSHTARIYTASTGGSLIDDTPSFTVTAEEVFANPRYWGVSASTSLNSAGIIALAGTDSVQAKAKDATAFAPSDQYTYYAYPAAHGLLTWIAIDGPQGSGFNSLTDYGTSGTPATVSVTPPGGSATNYYVYRSVNLLNVSHTLAHT